MPGPVFRAGRRPTAGALLASVSALLALGAFAVGADPGGTKTYRVTIENLTPDRGNGASQVLSPTLVVAHGNKADLFTVGEPANQAVIDVAEDAIGATGIAALSGNPNVGYVDQLGGPIPPGQSTSFEFTAPARTNLLSLVTMLVNTNDAFTGIDAMRLTGRRSERLVRAYDAGSEVNDQLLSNIPGPCCGDTGRNGTDESGVITHHPGIEAGVGDLDPATWGWPVNDPVARITVERVR